MRLRLVLAACLALLPGKALAQANLDRFRPGGDFRIQARPDFQGGNGRLGFWNLYGRLMNEGPYGALELRLDLLQASPGTDALWASIYARVEGGSFTNADSGNGNLINFRVSQLYVRAGNIGLPKLIWQLGTLQYFFGDLGLYDLRVAQIFDDTVGLSVRFPGEKVDVLAGIGDSGFGVRGLKYVPLLTAGGALRVRASRYFEFGGGGPVSYEPFGAADRVAGELLLGARRPLPLAGVGEACRRGGAAQRASRPATPSRRRRCCSTVTSASARRSWWWPT